MLSEPDTTVQHENPSAGFLVGLLGLLIGLAPSIYLVTACVSAAYDLAIPWCATNWFILVFAPSLVGFVVCAPLAETCGEFANDYGSKFGEKLAKVGAAIFYVPFLAFWIMEVVLALAVGPRFP